MSKPAFDGETYNEPLDGERLKSQLFRVRDVMLVSGDWWTLRQLARAVNGSEAGVSARLRDLRKPRFGGYIVESRRVKDADGFVFPMWEYRVLEPPESGQLRLL